MLSAPMYAFVYVVQTIIGLLKRQKAYYLNDSKPFVIFGGARRDRTDDLLNAIQALSQLSYSPEWCEMRCFL